MPDKEWRIRVRTHDGYPPTYYGPITRAQVAEFVTATFAREYEQLFDITVTRGDCGGEINEWHKAPPQGELRLSSKELGMITALLDVHQKRAHDAGPAYGADAAYLGVIDGLRERLRRIMEEETENG